MDNKKHLQKYWENGNLRSDEYYENGFFHNIDRPAYTFYYENVNGQKKRVEYYYNGFFHRIGGPAIIEYFSDGNICFESYWENGAEHRVDGPARIFYYKSSNGMSEQIQREEYYKNGQLCDNKVINYDEMGKIINNL